MYNPFSLERKTILVTGASSGIGRGIAIECSKMGACLIITGRNQDRLNETLSLLQGDGHKSIIADLSNISDISSLVEQLPKLDGVVNNAGVNDKSLVKFISKDKIDKIYHTNFYAPVLIIQSLLKSKKINKYASLIFISSISSNYASASNALYASSKGAINSFAKSLAIEVAPQKIRVNVIQPGIIKTPILEAYSLKEELDSFIKSCPLGTLGTPEDIAYCGIYLLSDASKWVTGSIITVDGGITLK